MPRIDSINYKTYHNSSSLYLATIDGETQGISELKDRMNSFKNDYTKKTLNIESIKGLDKDSFMIDNNSYLYDAAIKIQNEIQDIDSQMEDMIKRFDKVLKDHKKDEAQKTLEEVLKKYEEKIGKIQNAMNNCNNFADKNIITDNEGNEKKYKKVKYYNHFSHDSQVPLIVYYGGEIDPPSYYTDQIRNASESASSFYDSYVKPAKKLHESNNG